MSHDLKKPIIIDLGSSEIKAGFFDNSSPKIRLKNIIGDSLSKRNNSLINKNKEHYISSECDKYYNDLTIRYPIQRGVFIKDDDIQLIFEYILTKLGLNTQQMKEHPLLITEPINNKLSNSEKISEILFEKMNIPSLIFAKQPLLSLISTGYSTGVVLESGSDITQSCVSYEGYLIENSFYRFDYGGRDVSGILKILLKQNNPKFNSNILDNNKVLNEIKENQCYIKTLKDENEDFVSIPSEYILPDGGKLVLNDEKILAPEILFNNKLIFGEYLTFQEMVINSINKVDINIKNKLYKTIILSGGNTKFKGIEDKMKTNLSYLIPRGVDVKIRTQINPELNCWNGGNIIASLNTFNKMLVNKKEWDECGKNIIHIKNI
jgi:actin beta/gamma 1